MRLLDPPVLGLYSKGAVDLLRTGEAAPGPCMWLTKKDTGYLLKQVARTRDIIIRRSLQENRELKGSEGPEK